MIPNCDGQTDGFTIASTARCIASYADTLSKRLKLGSCNFHHRVAQNTRVGGVNKIFSSFMRGYLETV